MAPKQWPCPPPTRKICSRCMQPATPATGSFRGCWRRVFISVSVAAADACADAFRNRETVLHSFASFAQLASVDGSTLRAPDGEYDDRAISYALACAARAFVRWQEAEESVLVPAAYGMPY